MPVHREEPDHEIAIVGAGISGIGAADALLRAGFHDLVLLERAGDVGGTWRSHTYPGVGVDVPAHAYQFSHHLDPGWRRFYAAGHEVRAYVQDCANRFGVRPHVRTHIDVVARAWDAGARLWRLRTRDPRAPDGPEHELTARFVVSAIGPFPEPRPPGIAGLEAFGGDVVHVADWDHRVPIAGRRVAVVGTGASAVQVVPELAACAAHLTVFQRTPAWVSPKVDPPVPRPVRALLRRAPRLRRAVHRLVVARVEGIVVTAVVEHARHGGTTRAYERFLRHVVYRLQVRDPELRARLTPAYGYACRRPAASNRYLRTFTRPHVDLVTAPIARACPAGIRTTGGAEHAVDVIVLATGLRVATDPETYEARPVRGRDGFDLATSLRTERAHSYESVSIPGLPNHFTIFGPYGWTGGTWHALVETASAHVVRVLGEARRRGATVVEVRPEAAARWTAFAAGRMAGSLWQSDRCVGARGYYVDRHGDSPFLRPTSTAAAWAAARTFPLEDYAFAEAETEADGVVVAATGVPAT